MEIVKLIVLIIWGLVGLTSIGLTIYGVKFYGSMFKGLNKKDEEAE